MMGNVVIEVRALRKLFDGLAAVDGLDLRVGAGSVCGFLGRNGAGKSTTIRLLLGFLRNDGGEVRLFGQNVLGPGGGVEIRSRIGYVSENKHLYPYMTVRQIIRFTRPFFTGWRDDLERHYLELFQLPPDRKVSALSKGMRTGLMLLLAISHNPELLILDEPTEGLDPVITELVLRELVGLPASEGTTIFFSSHQLSEVEQIADHVAIIDRGRAVLAGAVDDMRLQYQRVRIVFPGDPPPITWAEGAERVRSEGRTVSILASRNVDVIVDQARALAATSVERRPVTLKEIFLEHVGTN